jgi:oxepin-CoA hydrolase/3-oxo-5,6-dehydrosuberyl-CoA semialdehyde dehydrogenase
MPYKTIDEAIELSKMGKGSLVSSIVTADDRIASMYTVLVLLVCMVVF